MFFEKSIFFNIFAFDNFCIFAFHFFGQIIYKGRENSVNNGRFGPYWKQKKSKTIFKKKRKKNPQKKQKSTLKTSEKSMWIKKSKKPKRALKIQFHNYSFQTCATCVSFTLAFFKWGGGHIIDPKVYNFREILAPICVWKSKFLS